MLLPDSKYGSGVKGGDERKIEEIKSPNICSYGDKTCDQVIKKNPEAAQDIASILKESDIFSHNMSFQDILKRAKKKFNCKTLDCVIEKMNKVNPELYTKLKSLFKPEGPGGVNLLSNLDIDSILKKFKEDFPNKNFYPMKFQMIDFDDYNTELNKEDLLYDLFYNKNYKTFGVVVNTDLTTGRGIHWFCLFAEKTKDGVSIEYFNSSGNSPRESILKWLHNNNEFIRTNGEKSVIKESTGINYQNDDHSCGVYCLAYIWMRLHGMSHEEFTDKNFTDELMLQARKALFSNN